jgi:carbon-monoxide dehydrogenase medium subunit
MDQEGRALPASDTELSIPTSAAEASQAFGDGQGVTVLAGGTILMPLIAHGHHRAGARTLVLERAGLDGIKDDGSVQIGAMASLSVIAASGIEPLASAAREVADLEVRAQATLGGNLCAPPSDEAPRGDLQAALLAADARVTSAGAGGERTEAVEEFLARIDAEPRLVLGVELERPAAASYLSQRRPHAHSYSVMCVACARTSEGVRVAAGGIAPRAIRLAAVERAFSDSAGAEQAAAAALDGITPHDDALASAWYRQQVLPTLVKRALEQLEGG